MNDEIKVNKENKTITFINNGIAFSQFGIADEILDLITNLQEELKGYKQERENLFRATHDLQKKIKRYQKELEKADSITQSCVFEGSRSAGKSYRQCLNRLEDYKSRIDKAIPMLKRLNIKLKDILKIGIDIREISNIEIVLQGSDKE